MLPSNYSIMSISNIYSYIDLLVSIDNSCVIVLESRGNNKSLIVKWQVFPEFNFFVMLFVGVFINASD